MSRIGKKSISIPSGVTVTVAQGSITVKGPKGELCRMMHPHVSVTVQNGHALVTVKQPENQDDRALWGLWGSLIKNMIAGVLTPFTKQLQFVGVGYKVAISNHKLTLEVGFSHPVEFELPKEIEAKVEKNMLTLTGINNEVLGEIAAQLRRIQPPEPYKGKGIKYADEVVRRKAGKAAKAGSAAK